MANEATLVFETHVPIPFTVANGTGIEKGASLTLSDPMTAATLTASGAAFAGFAAEEKIASDGRTRMATYRGGIFKVTASGAVTVGEAVTADTANKFVRAAVNNEHLAGIALETAADGETFLMELRPTHVNLA